MYTIKFIQYWNGSFNPPDVSVPIFIEEWNDLEQWWSVPPAAWIIDTGSLKKVAGTYDLWTDTIRLDAGKYKIEFDITDYVSGEVALYLRKNTAAGAIVLNTEYQSSNDTFEIIGNIDAGNYVLFIDDKDSSPFGANGRIDNIKLSKLNNSSNINIIPSDIELISADIDPVKFIGDDFFMREPRKCKLKLLDNSDNFLLNNFIYNDGLYGEDELNVIIWYDEDGEIIDDITNKTHWGSEQIYIGMDVGGKIVTDKETIIQQISKIAIEISNDNTVEYVGLIDKATSSYDLDYITLECVDFLWIFKMCAEQFIKVLDNPEFEYMAIFSPLIIKELYDKIVTITRINIDMRFANSEHNNGNDTIETFIKDSNEIFTGDDNAIDGNDISVVNRMWNLSELRSSLNIIEDGTPTSSQVRYIHSFSILWSCPSWDAGNQLSKTVDLIPECYLRIAMRKMLSSRRSISEERGVACYVE